MLLEKSSVTLKNLCYKICFSCGHNLTFSEVLKERKMQLFFLLASVSARKVATINRCSRNALTILP